MFQDCVSMKYAAIHGYHRTEREKRILRMNDRQIACFLAVAKSLSFSQASRELYLSQPAISHQIKMLEKELETQLFYRDTTVVQLTEAGYAFREDAEKMQRLYHSMERRMEQFRVQKTVRLRVPPTMVLMDQEIYREIVHCIADKIAGVQIETSFIDGEENSVEALLKGEIDFLIIDINLKCLQRRDICFEPLFHSQQKVMMSHTHRLASREQILLADLSGENIYDIRQDTCLIPGVLKELRKNNIPFHTTVTETYNMTCPLIELNQGISFIDMDFFTDSGIIYVPLAAETQIQIGLVWKDDKRDKSFADIAGQVKKYYQKRKD